MIWSLHFEVSEFLRGPAGVSTKSVWREALPIVPTTQCVSPRSEATNLYCAALVSWYSSIMTYLKLLPRRVILAWLSSSKTVRLIKSSKVKGGSVFQGLFMQTPWRRHFGLLSSQRIPAGPLARFSRANHTRRVCGPETTFHQHQFVCWPRSGLAVQFIKNNKAARDALTILPQ